MTRLRRWSAVGLAGALLAAAAGVAHADPAPPTAQVVGGTPARQGDYPWMTRMKTGWGGCGGTLVSPDVVITAAHCYKFGGEGITAWIGNVNFAEGEQRKGVSKVNGKGEGAGDWSVVKLDKPYAAASYPVFPADGAHDAGPTFRAMGWGATKENGQTSKVLLQVDLPKVDDALCAANGNIQAEVCAGDYEKGGIDTCQGDSGGPLVKRDGDRWVFVGIVSRGVGCARPKNPGYYTRVSAFRDDIRKAIQQLGGQLPAGL
ncbi:trypsin [Pilimelia terevasa]|uniref:Trypsin n=1 Tax=Pilimelia terevasa TaxID=53372 RepID=A0A8J3BTV3_9ACTN|nr:serine protease [Pilimelia terevasa]GGK35650.1 trypsin [Pilimelia terevasa]